MAHIRRAHTRAPGERIAFVWVHTTRTQAARDPFMRRVFLGARRRAEIAGFALEQFWMGDPGMTAHRSRKPVRHLGRHCRTQRPNARHSEPDTRETIITFDASIGYGRRILKRYHWDVQLNIRNVFDRTELVPQRALSTGQAVNFGVDAPRSCLLTNTFSI